MLTLTGCRRGRNCRWLIACATLLVVASGLRGRSVHATDVLPSIPLAVIVYDDAQVPAEMFEEATRVALGVYQRIGVEITWYHAQSPRLARIAAEGGDWVRRMQPAVFVRLLSPAMTQGRHLPPQVLGEALRGARWALVLTPRVIDSAERQHARPGLLLGLVMAHEIGHLLLPTSQHSLAGLMTAALDKNEVAREQLRFDPAEGRQIREQLTRLRAASAGVEANAR